MAFFGNVSDWPDSPTFSKLCCADSQTRRDSPKAIFEKNVTRLAKFARVIRNSRKFGASGHCLEPMSSDENQNSHSLLARKVSLESGAFDRSAILTYILILILNNIWTSFIKYLQFNALLKLYCFYELVTQESLQIWMPFLHNITHLTKFLDNKTFYFFGIFFLFLTASIYHKLYKNRIKGLVPVSFKLASNCLSDSWSFFLFVFLSSDLNSWLTFTNWKL
jgi:hypothetical protein